MQELLYSIIFAIQFLTRIPLVRNLDQKNVTIQKSLIFFPAVGFIIGLVLYIICTLLNSLNSFHPLTLALFIITAETIITGALHIDGIADTFDALLSSHASQEQKLSIMKDSRIGVMGATAVVLSVLLKTALIAELLDRNLWSALLIYPAAGRWAQVMLFYLSRYLRESGTAWIFAQSINGMTVFLSSLWLLPCLLFPSFYLVFLLLLLAVLIYRSFIHRTIGGITGDIIGSGSVIAEIVVLAGMVIGN